MDVWCFEDDSHHSSSSSGSLPPITFSEYLSSFSCIDDNYIAEIPPDERDDLVQFGDLELLNSSTTQLQGQLDEPQTRRCLQSNLFYHEQSLLPSDKSCYFDPISSIYTKSDMPVLQKSIIAMDQHTYAQFSLPMGEEMAITRAMVSVISSSSSSSSSSSLLPSSSSTSSYQHLSQRRAQTYQSQVTYDPPKMCSFQPYCSSISRKLESYNNVHSQSMIKKAHNMLRSVNKLKAEAKVEETQLTAYQMQHMVLERRRRERLNSSFHSLGKLLPPGSKKDKTAILCNTVSYMKTLKSEIYELEVNNRVLEEHVLPFEAEQHSIDRNERVQVKLRKSSQTKTEKQQIYLVIMVRVQCDLIRVVLHVLECIQTMKAISLLSLDANPNTEQMKIFATLKLAIEVSTWDERTFTEAITRAAHMGLSLSA